MAPPRSDGDEALPSEPCARALAEARALASPPHAPGWREPHRALLSRAIALAERALAEGSAPTEDVATALETLAHAHAARADDAVHGARQLSLSAQRAPTPGACDEGWTRVADRVALAGASADAARDAATELARRCPGPRSRRAARSADRAEGSAREGRDLLAARNRAYTFHGDAGFSFGEGWHVAAAAALTDATIQLEPDRPGTAQAERFLRDAGLLDRVRPYGPRPRAAKQTTALIAAAFRADPVAAGRALRAAFLGDGTVPPAVAAWADARFAGAPAGPRVLLWVRDGVYHPARNTDVAELVELAARARRAGLSPVVVGEAPRDGGALADVVDLTRFSRDPVFAHVETRRAQLLLFEHLSRAHGLVGQVGVTTAGMDGPALLGLPTLYLTEAPNPRMGAWVGAVPGYREVVRDGAHLAAVDEAFAAWARRGAR